MDFQTEIDQENLVLNHMTNVAVQTHQIKDSRQGKPKKLNTNNI